MSQVRKYDGGGAAAPQTPTTPTPGQLTFNIDGNAYKTDEQSIRDKFNSAFSTLVQRGEANERDRADWVNSNNKIIENAKNGTYNINSGGKSVYNEGYTGSASASDLGLNPDGSSARKTWVGNIISRGSKNDAQRINMLEGMLGNSLIGDSQASSAASKLAAQQAADKAKGLTQDANLNQAKRWSTSFGNQTYGKNFSDDPNLILSKWFGKGMSNDQRSNMMLANLKSKYTQLFDPKWDTEDNKNLLKQNGIDIDDLRQHASQYWDKNTNSFIGKPDILSASEPFGTMHDDNIFLDKAAYDKSIADKSKQGQPAVDPNAPKPLTAAGNLFTDGKQFWQDKDRTKLQTGFNSDGTLYDEKGQPMTGWHLHDNNPYNKFTGWYQNGKQGKFDQGVAYMAQLGNNPANESALKDIQSQQQGIRDAYTRVINDPHWLSASANQNTNDDSSNVWDSEQQHGTAKKKTQDISMLYPNLNGKANIQQYQSSQMNQWGVPEIYHKVTLANGKSFYGTVNADMMGNVTGMNDPNGHAIMDHDLVNTLKGLKYDPHIANTNWANTTYARPGSAPTTQPGITKSVAQSMANPASSSLPSGVYFNKPGGVLKAQGGGTFDPSASVAAATGGGGNNSSRKVTVGDIGKSINDPNYHISGSDKAELAALGLNLGSLATSIFGGGGAGVAAGLGAAGTATQFGADVAKDGLTWGNAGSALLGLGLDAASVIPGLGVLSEGSKVAKTIARTARIAIPLLTAAGFVHGAGVFADIASGKKGISDLNFEDMRALTQGLTAISGGARYATELAGTAPSKISTITLKDGTPVTLDEAGLNAINAAKPEDKSSVIQSVVSRITGKSGDDIALAQKTKIGMPNSWNPLNKFGMVNSVDNTNVVNTSTGRVPINPESIQGDGLWNNFKRFAANKAQIRDLNTTPPVIDPKYKLGENGDIDQTSQGAASPSNWSIFGDYVQNPRAKYNAALNAPGEDLGSVVGARREDSGNYTSSPAQPTYEYENGKTATVGNVPDTRRIYGSMFGMRSLDNERSVSYNEIRNRMQGLQGTASSRDQLKQFMSQKFEDGSFGKAIQDQINEAITNKTARGYVKFKEGGKIKKHQWGGTTSPSWVDKLSGNANYMNAQNNFIGLMSNSDGSQSYTPIDGPNKDPFGVGKLIRQTGTQFNPNQAIDPNKNYASGVNPLGQTSTASTPTSTTPTSSLQPPASNPQSGYTFTPTTPRALSQTSGTPGFNINPNSLSELGRALYTRSVNQQIDTRVERPMLNAPMEIPISVRGNMYAQNVANQQADNLVRNTQQFKTSDGNLQMLGQLEAERQGAGLRMQGAMQNNQELEQTRQQAQQNAMQNAMARTNVANENVQTNARATQAEREANNQKLGMVNQPLLDYWKDQDYKSYIQSQQNKAVDTQIGGIGVENMTRGTMQQLSMAAQKVWYDDSIPQDQKMAKYTQIQNQMAALQGKISQTELQLRKDPYGTKVPGMDYFLQGIDPSILSHASGGEMVRRESLRQQGLSNKAATQAYTATSDAGLADQTKKQLESMKEINDLIKLALR